jgi:hypothetical protein
MSAEDVCNLLIRLAIHVELKDFGLQLGKQFPHRVLDVCDLLGGDHQLSWILDRSLTESFFQWRLVSL